MEIKIKQLVASVFCFVLSFAVALYASWLLRNGPVWYGVVVYLWTFALVIGLVGLSVYFAGKAFEKGKSR